MLWCASIRYIKVYIYILSHYTLYNIPKTVKNDVTAAQDFFGLVLDAHIIAAAMQCFGMKNVSDTPTQNEFLGDLSVATDEEKKKYIPLFTKAFLRKFVLNHIQMLDGVVTMDGTNSTVTTSSMDGVFDYACTVIGFGLMARNFSDAIREGDGERLLRCWKFFMLHFKADWEN